MIGKIIFTSYTIIASAIMYYATTEMPQLSDETVKYALLIIT